MDFNFYNFRLLLLLNQADSVTILKVKKNQGAFGIGSNFYYSQLLSSILYNFISRIIAPYPFYSAVIFSSYLL